MKRGRRERRTGWERKEGERRKGWGRGERKKGESWPTHVSLWTGRDLKQSAGAMVTKLEINVSKGEFYPALHRGIFPRGKYSRSMDFGCPPKPCVEDLVAIWKWRTL